MRSSRGYLAGLVLALLVSALSGALLAYLYQPLPPSRLAYLSHVVLASDGTVLARRLSADGYWREPISLAAIDPRLLELLIAYEDQRYWQHNGVDWLALLRATGDAVIGSITVSIGWRCCAPLAMRW